MSLLLWIMLAMLAIVVNASMYWGAVVISKVLGRRKIVVVMQN